MSIFEQATRQALRFNTTKGNLSVEDLWQLPLTSKSGVSLDGIAVGLYTQLNETKQISFVDAAAVSVENQKAQLQFDIVKHIIDVKKAENSAAANAREIAQHNQKILALIAQKKDDSLNQMSVEDLTALLK